MTKKTKKKGVMVMFALRSCDCVCGGGDVCASWGLSLYLCLFSSFWVRLRFLFAVVVVVYFHHLLPLLEFVALMYVF